MSKRVVVTGLGAVTPLGSGVETTWSGVTSGKSGVRTIEGFDTTDLSVTIAAQVPDFNPEPYVEKKEAKKSALFTQYALYATGEAVAQSGLSFEDEDLSRVGVCVGSGIGGINTITDNYQTMIEKGTKKLSPFFIPSCIINSVAGCISIKYGLRGPNISIVTACTTGTHNIGQALDYIRQGRAEVMIAGGTEMATSQITIGGFAACRALSKRNDEPTKASRPWDKSRDGFVLGEGAGIVILESLEHAKARGAEILAEVVGFGMSADAHHITLPEPSGQGAYDAMNNALKDANLNASDIQYINAHATSTPAGDEIETMAINRLFQEHADKLAVSGTKSMIGHLLGAAGSVEAVVTIKAIQDKVAPPTINLDEVDESNQLNLVPHESQPHDIEYALTNSFGFGGTNGALIFKRFSG